LVEFVRFTVERGVYTCLLVRGLEFKPRVGQILRGVTNGCYDFNTYCKFLCCFGTMS